MMMEMYITAGWEDPPRWKKRILQLAMNNNGALTFDGGGLGSVPLHHRDDEITSNRFSLKPSCRLLGISVAIAPKKNICYLENISK